MTFQQEFRASLEAGAVFPTLWDIAQHHQGRGMTLQQIYEVLQEIWLNYGYDDDPVDSPLRDELEHVMEKAWYARSG